ncbi:MAG TPA: serine/threonine-protein kinase [Solirubrobacteraceae bacterium]|nr:serine/threonine-protein kinase [Solirubrobacteraceae bacterium]
MGETREAATEAAVEATDHHAETLANGRYRLDARLGAGGMASVWLAHDTTLDRAVAIKLLSDVLCADADYVRRFQREARVAAGLSHPNLVNVFDYGNEGERPYLVMEYIEGGTLADRLRDPDTGAMPEPAELARQLLEALGYIHAAGIVHRDVKPSNVLLDRNGTVRLSDFGIAHPSGATRLTQTGQVLGTPRYIAPEVLAGQPSTPRSDLYSCGVLLQECLASKPVPGLVELVARLTADDPRRRPASAAEALDPPGKAADLTTATRPIARDGPPAPSESDTAPTGRELQIKLSAATAAAIAVAALAVVLAVVFLLTTTDSHRRSSGPSLPRPAPAGAPLGRQLDTLDRQLRQLRRH